MTVVVVPGRMPACQPASLPDHLALPLLSLHAALLLLLLLLQPLGVAVHAVEEPPAPAVQQRQDGAAAAAAVHDEEEEASSAALQHEVEARVAGLSPEAGALIIYTSGTTGRPKGALHTHASLAAQVDTLCRAWEWEQSDRWAWVRAGGESRGARTRTRCAAFGEGPCCLPTAAALRIRAALLCMQDTARAAAAPHPRHPQRPAVPAEHR